MPGNKKTLTKAERRAKYTQIARERSIKQRQRQEQRKLVCLRCRQRGHGVESCPQQDGNDSGRHANHKQKCCYKCGSLEHGLGTCPKRTKEPNEELPFATCFVCHAKGHLAGQCPNNDKGIYVNGGCCKTCGSKQHLSSQCPEKAKKRANQGDEAEIKGLPEVDNFDDLLSEEEGNKAHQSSDKEGKTSNLLGKEKKVVKKRRIVKF